MNIHHRLAELVRLFHNVSVEVARQWVSLIVERTIPIVWKVGDRLRILDQSLSYKEKTLALLYQGIGELHVDELYDWAEHPLRSNYIRDVLKPLHMKRAIEYNPESQTVTISPLGIQIVEEKNLFQ